MTLTKEEKAELELEKASCKLHCKEAWETLQALERIAKTYWRIHDHYHKRYRKADLTLAEHEKLVRYPIEEKKGGVKKKNLLHKLNKSDLDELLEEIEEKGGE